ncbi:hypothetical protein Zmor_024785 [Zophobas morio]|uniref:Uncharacterized protein n=1 Tax=Zophobas morio TaxID=2755281 RepID=A0AA38M8F4_9CUCU|nr:hypothetical protein Zmor_024785 [Zophobas morio]
MAPNHQTTFRNPHTHSESLMSLIRTFDGSSTVRTLFGHSVSNTCTADCDRPTYSHIRGQTETEWNAIAAGRGCGRGGGTCRRDRPHLFRSEVRRMFTPHLLSLALRPGYRLLSFLRGDGAVRI